MKILYIVVSVLLCISLTACSPKKQQAVETMEKPVDCSTAHEDIRVLEAERKSVGEQIAQGVTNIMPVGAVVRLFKGEWRDGKEVATGDYNNQLEAKINEIKVECQLL